MKRRSRGDLHIGCRECADITIPLGIEEYYYPPAVPGTHKSEYLFFIVRIQKKKKHNGMARADKIVLCLDNSPPPFISKGPEAVIADLPTPPPVGETW